MKRKSRIKELEELLNYVKNLEANAWEMLDKSNYQFSWGLIDAYSKIIYDIEKRIGKVDSE